MNWPPERFYWSVLEAPGLTSVGPLPPGLRAGFEDDAPEPGESLHAVCAPAGDGRVLVCAARRADLEAMDPGVLALTPESVPPFAAVDPGCLNLLVGTFEPRSIKRARARRHLRAIATVGLCAALVSTGLARRAGAWDRRAADAARATHDLVQAVQPGAMPEALGAELERARRERGAELKPPQDAALGLASILAAWPASVPSKPQSIVVNGASAWISVAFEGEATPFLKAFAAPPAWTLLEPQLNTAGTITRVTLQLRRGGAP